MNNKALSILGLAQKSRNLVSGDDTTMTELKKLKVNLIILAEDASDNTKKMFIDKATYRNVDYIVFSNKQELGKAIGKMSRAVIGVKNESFAKKIKEIVGGESFVKDKSI